MDLTYRGSGRDGRSRSKVRTGTNAMVRIGPVIILVTILLFLTWQGRPVMGQKSAVDILSYRVNGAPNYSAPGNETFWKNVVWTNVPLSASVSPGGGHTSDVLVKSANDGFNIYVLFRWNDSLGPSYETMTEIWNDSGKIVPLNYNQTGLVTGLVHNSTYYYPDRVAMLWFLNGTRDVVPAMKLNSTGVITDGSANIWHWQSVPTDNISFSSSAAGNYTDPSGKTIFPPNNSSFAEDDYTDKNGFFPVAGYTAGAPNLVPYADPFDILAGNYYSATNKTWTIEMVRPFVEPPAGQYRIQLSVGSTYFVGFGVWNGRAGESSHIKSVSQWYRLTVSNQPPPSSVTPVGGVSFPLATATGIGLLTIGVIIGIAVRPEKKKPVA